MIQKAFASALPLLPRRLVARFARRYMAGPTLEEALAVVQQLAADGCLATLDVLGEQVRSVGVAEETRATYERCLRALVANGLRGGVSVKLTSLGLDLGGTICRKNFFQILATAAGLRRFVRVDMEEARYADPTLDLVVDAHRQGQRVGAVIQARLRRSPADAVRLGREGVPVRLVKGIYLEPAAIAHTGFEEIRAGFLRTFEHLLEARVEVAIATHDDFLVDRSLAMVQAAGLPASGYEFQLLLGVRPDLRRCLVAAGHRVRVYVPFGPAWLAYSLRRLRENPALAALVLKNLL
jgi:proline dehydrogenase